MKNLFLVLVSVMFIIGACKNTVDTVTPTTAVMTGDVQLVGGGAGDPRPDSLHLPDSSRCGNSRRITVDSLPQITKTYISTNYAGFNIIKLFKQVRSDTTRFIVVVSKDTTTKVLIFDKNGNFKSVHNAVNGHPGSNHGRPVGGFKDEDVSPDALLPAIKTYIATNYVGYTIKKGEKETHNGVVEYEVEIYKGTTKKKLVFDAAGKFLRELK